LKDPLLWPNSASSASTLQNKRTIQKLKWRFSFKGFFRTISQTLICQLPGKIICVPDSIWRIQHTEGGGGMAWDLRREIKKPHINKNAIKHKIVKPPLAIWSRSWHGSIVDTWLGIATFYYVILVTLGQNDVL